MVEARHDTGECLTSSNDLEGQIRLISNTLGNFTKALVQVPPGKNLLGFGSMMSWNEWVLVWGRVHRVECRFERLDRKFVEDAVPSGVGAEIADMFEYVSDFGYDGGDPSVVHPSSVSSPSFFRPDITNFVTAWRRGSCLDCRTVYQDRGLVVHSLDPGPVFPVV